MQVGSQSRSCVIKGDGGGINRGNICQIRLDNTEDQGPEWSRTVEDLYTSDRCDSTEVGKFLRDSN